MFVETTIATVDPDTFDYDCEYAQPLLSDGAHQICSQLFRGAIRDVTALVRTLASRHPKLFLIQNGENALAWINGASAPLTFDDVCWGLGKNADAERFRLKRRLRAWYLLRTAPVRTPVRVVLKKEANVGANSR